MKIRNIRQSMLILFRENARSYVIGKILRQDLEDYRAEYRKRNNAELPSKLEARFMEWAKAKAASEADEIIEACVDGVIASEYKWLPFRNIAITGVLIAPAILALIMYAIKHFSYLMGNKDIFTGLSYEGLAGTVFAILGLSIVLLASCIDELRKD